jgi:peptidoglycan/xylan/chitin deacetylase (PgdA/CDA1 family)
LNSARIRVMSCLLAATMLGGQPAASDCRHPGALGIHRTIEIDTAGGPLFGQQQYDDHDLLQSGEIVLTFDDGPWPVNTRMVLTALAQHCTKATFFPVGKHAVWHPEILREVHAAGHTIGSHTWSHPYLSKLAGNDAIEEIEKGFSVIKRALDGTAPAPFFRFPFLDDPASLIAYLGGRNIATFSNDIDSLDYMMEEPDVVISSVLNSLRSKHKGIILLHDYQGATARAALKLLDGLKAGGYKVVHFVPKEPLVTIPAADVAAERELRGEGTERPTKGRAEGP